MFCTQCGNKINENTQFCENCGNKIHTKVKVDDKSLNVEKKKSEKKVNSKKDEPEVKKKKKWGWIFITFFIYSILKGVEERISTNDNLLFTMLFILIGPWVAPLFYYWIRPKIKIIKNIRVGNFIIGLSVIVIFPFLIMIFGAFCDTIFYAITN